MNRFLLLFISFLFGFSITIEATHTEKINIAFNQSDLLNINGQLADSCRLIKK